MVAQPLRSRGVAGLLTVAAVLVLVTLFICPTRLYAAPSTPELPDDVETCQDCHSIETMTWQNSPHATVTDPDAGAVAAVCTDCHGDYVAEHPDAGVMTLEVASTTCSTCHDETYSQWEHTTHAQGGVQCIGCHQAHSQDLRLETDALCTSCHNEPNEDAFHTAHWLSQVACTDCHMAEQAATQAIAAVDPQAAAMILAPTHDFVTVSPMACLDCHRDDVDTASWQAGSDQHEHQAMLNESRNAAILAAELNATASNLRTYQFMTPVALGLGLGLGGMVGIIFMVVAGHWGWSRQDNDSAVQEPDREGRHDHV